MTRVCHITSTHGNHDQRILLKECVSLANAGYEVFQVAKGDDGEYEGVTLVGTGETKPSLWYRFLVRPRHVYKRALELDADIYHFHDMELLPYAKKLKKHGKKVIFDCHEDFASRFAESDALPLPKPLMRLLAKAYARYESGVVSKMDAVISVTPHICDRLARDNDNTVMITNYPIVDPDSPWSQPREYDQNSDYLCFTGQVSCKLYGLDVAVRAMQGQADHRFVIAGPPRRESDLELIAAEDKDDVVDYLGTVPYLELPALVGGSFAALVTVAYIPNTCGRLGTLGVNKLFEAMLCGVPVIFTNFELWHDINERYHFGFEVEQGDVGELKAAISAILKNPQEAADMGKRGREAVLSEFNWKSQEEKLFDLYERIK